MHKPPLLTSNFACLQEHDEQLLRLGMLAERYFPDDPNTSLLKLRQLTELLAQLVAKKVGLYQSPEESQYDLLRRLQDQGILPREIAQLFSEVRRAGNAAWFTHNPDLGKILDSQSEGQPEPVFVSHHDDRLLGTERGYGRATRPEDYLHEFSDFIRSRSNAIPALITVLTRPREITRKQLCELALELDKAGFSEASLATAWREMTNQDIAARIVGYIRQAAIGDPLVPYDQRVDRALQKLLASRQWSTPQSQWLQRIAAQTKTNMLVDREALYDPDLVFRREGSGFTRLDRIFGGELLQVLDTFNESLWTTA
jgi:type I restriction enzyme R subunit